MIKITEIQCKSILTRSRIPGIDYTICPYIGCEHKCVYCYVRFMGFAREKKWGSFLYVKINGDRVLKKQLRRIKEKTRISISTATDPYQPIEKKYALTRNILKELIPHKILVSILTKSALVTRDIDIFKDMWDVEIGFTITTTDEHARKTFEPYASSVEERFLALEALKKAGIKTYVFIGPILPYFTEHSLPELMERVKDCGVERIVIDRLNYIRRLRLDEKVAEYYPGLTLKYKDTDRKYFDKVKELIVECCKEYNMDYNVCF